MQWTYAMHVVGLDILVQPFEFYLRDDAEYLELMNYQQPKRQSQQYANQTLDLPRRSIL